MPPLFGLAPGGVCHAAAVTGRAVRFYRTLSPLPVRLPSIGGLLSVALSLNRRPESRRPGGRYPPPSFRGARTFLGGIAPDAAARLPGTGTI